MLLESRKDAKYLWFFLAMQVPTAPQWWSKRSMQYPHLLQCAVFGARQMLHVGQYFSLASHARQRHVCVGGQGAQGRGGVGEEGGFLAR
mmetsp:Transcript_23462/g.73612  ORF Transcript_23462/g.73612 Transcript_23462/m.73612 type:complete len:89 (-) Transcript_23462:33-299(-)